MKFRELIQIEGVRNEVQKGSTKGSQGSKTVRQKPRSIRNAGRGCENCTLDQVKGVKKIFSRVRGKSIFIWGQSPGPIENKQGEELLGPAGKWWWSECEAVGIRREDCDIQNVVRCFPADRDEDEWPPLKMRNPTKDEVKCCSVYNERALEQSKAKVHIILGQIAAQILLGREYSKDSRVIWSKKFKAKVICLDHPAFFLRRGGGSGNDTRLQQFRRDLKFAASVANTRGGRFGFIKSQNYRGVTSIKQARKAYKEIRAFGDRGIRVSADLEEGKVDSRGRGTYDCRGRRAPLVYGFSGKVGTAVVFPLEHPDAPVSPRVRKYCRKLVRKLLSDPEIKFVFQHGSYDVKATAELLNCRIRNYDYDTNYAEFFKYPERYSFALDAIAEARFPEFAGYKEITVPDAFTEQSRQYFKDHKMEKATLAKKHYMARKKIKNGLNYALLPWEKIVLYNGADNDLQKRIEVTTKNHISLPLLHVYRDAAFVVDLMEKNPPKFDYKHYENLLPHYPPLRDRLFKKLVKMSGKPDFNPNSPQQVSYVLYQKLHLPVVGDKPDTTKETMAVLSEYHKFPSILVQYRRVNKICTTYLAGFKASADANNGCVRTIWWLTGTRTGRLSSGGGDSGEEGVVNLQNIHGDALLQCLLISDPLWREVYQFWRASGGFDKDTWQQFADMDVFLGFDHSQMELRCVAQKSGDKNLIKAFQSGVDIHSQVGHQLTGWPVEQIMEDEGVRRLIKNMQFGIVYGLNENNLANYMRAKGVKDVNDAQVKKFYRLYFKRFAGVARMIEADREFVKKNGYAVTLFGFKRRLNVSENSEGGAYWGNQAVNSPIQGTAHQLMLMGLVPLQRNKEKYKLLRKPQLEIHDAIYFIVKLKDLFKGALLGQEMLEKDAIEIVKNDFGIDWKVPLKAEPKGALRFGIQIKDIGGKGPKNEWEFLNKWCEKNRELQIRFQKEHRELLGK